MKCIKYISGIIAFIAFMMLVGTFGAADEMVYGELIKKAVIWALVFIVGYSVANIANIYDERE